MPPRYLPQAQRRRIEGRVEVRFTLRGEGRFYEVGVVSSEPPGVFDRGAMGAMQR